MTTNATSSSTSLTCRSATNEAAPNPVGTCNACQRTGLPILPLRTAYAPLPYATQEQPVAYGSDLKGVRMDSRQLRTLRQGYVYVLLDKTEWQAYQVTPEGFLRQFRPCQSSREEPRPLGELCIVLNHDIPASFINIDTERYHTAWIAFSSDPWPQSVLDRYRQGISENGTALNARFRQINLQEARENPASVGIAMTAEAPQVYWQVLEYGTPTAGDFDSVHGFSTRNHRLGALCDFIRTQTKSQQLPQGVLALVLPDPVGIVQEINHQRLTWQRRRSEYEGDPTNNYKLFTSETIKILREMYKQEADTAVPAVDDKDFISKTTPWWHPSNLYPAAAFIHPAAASIHTAVAFANTEQRKNKRRANLVEEKTRELLGRLEERYSEPNRAAFETEFNRTKQLIQDQIDQMAERYASHLDDLLFHLVERYDYDANVADSVVCYIQTFEACLRGGITEATSEPDADGNFTPIKGPSTDVWKHWVQDGQSIVFKTLLAHNSSLMDSLLPSLSSQGDISWNDFDKAYDVVTKIIDSRDFGEKLIQPKVAEAIASILAAYNGAVSRLGDTQISKSAKNLATWVNNTSLRLYCGCDLTPITVNINLGSYYTQLCELIRENNNQLQAKIKSVNGPIKKNVKSILAIGIFCLAITKPELCNRTVEVVLWVKGTASDLRQQFGNDLQKVGQWTDERLSKVKILAGTLEPGARRVLEELQLRASDVNRLAHAGLRVGRNTTSIAGGTLSNRNLLIAVGGTYLLSQSLNQSLDAIEKTIGEKNDEALLAMYSAAFGVLGGAIESLGLAMEVAATLTKETLRIAPSGGARAMNAASLRIARYGIRATNTALNTGTKLVKFGGILGSISGVFDALTASHAARRTARSGDLSASRFYTAAAICYAASATAATAALMTGSATILGAGALLLLSPLGWAIILGIAAFGFAYLATKNESSLLERWVQYSHFGSADKELKWPDSETAVAALNAAVLGIDISLRFSGKTPKKIESDNNQSQNSLFRKPKISDIYVLENSTCNTISPVSIISPSAILFPTLEYQLILPHYDASHSSYNWRLTAIRNSGKELLASGSYPLTTPAPTTTGEPRTQLDYAPTMTIPTIEEKSISDADEKKSDIFKTKGTIELKTFHRINEIEFDIQYIPNTAHPEMMAEIRITETHSMLDYFQIHALEDLRTHLGKSPD